MERYDDALAALDRADQLGPKDPDLDRSRAVILACSARITDAIAEFERFARRWPAAAQATETEDTLQYLRRIQEDEMPTGSYLADHLLEQVGDNMNLGDWHIVERKGRRVIAADPQRPEGHFVLGLACLEQKRHPEALEAFLAAHALEADYAPTMHNIGLVYVELGQPEQAIPWLERALDQEPESLSALYQMGRAYQRLGRLEEAADYWRRVLRANPEHRAAQERLHEIGQGPAPQDPPPPPQRKQMVVMTPIVKARMRHSHVHRNGGVTLTWDGSVGFVLEDTENPNNYTIHAGEPFRTARLSDRDILDLMGLIKQLLTMIDAGNTRDAAVLAYYEEQPIFGYQARFEGGERVHLDADGQFNVRRVPRFFKVRIDSDLITPIGDPMQGTLIYLNQRPRPGFMLTTLNA
jgi:tetratricopeptide (TPR) repeat protein